MACFNYGVLLGASGKNDEAILYYRQAIAANPIFCHPRTNIGLAYERLSDPEKAIAEWRAVVDESPMKEAAPIDMKTAALNHIGRLKEQQREFEEAEAALAESLMLNPKQRDAIHHWFHLRQKQCKWPALTEIPGVSKNMILQSMSPLAALAFEDDPAYQMFVGDQIVRQKFTFDNPPLFSGEGYKHTKIKIG